jgi:gluconolactonase
MRCAWLVLASAAALLLWPPTAGAVCGDDEVPGRGPDASIDLTTTDGTKRVAGTWRYADVRIVETDFRKAGADGQPTGAVARTYDIEPHAGGADFDDGAWEAVAPEDLDLRRGNGRFSFNWYRIAVVVPDHIDGLDTRGTTIVFETNVDDYAEIWVDGEIPRCLGQSGGSVVRGWNAPNRVVIARNAKPGQRIQLAVFGMNGPISDPVTNYIWMRAARLEFYREATVPRAIAPREVNVAVLRLDPSVNRIVPANAKLFKLAEGFELADRPVWSTQGRLRFRDVATQQSYEYRPDDRLDRVEDTDGALTPPGDGPLLARAAIDASGHRFVATPKGVRILAPGGEHLGTIVPSKQATNLAFGGADGRALYLTTRDALYRIPLLVSGHAPRRP